MQLSIILPALAASAHAMVIDRGTVVTRQEPALPPDAYIVACPTLEQPFGNCTRPETPFWQCPGATFRGADAAIHEDITSANQCTGLCNQDAACDKASWDSANNICYIKAAEPLEAQFWMINENFTTIRRNTVIDPAIMGQWSELHHFPVVPIAGYVVPQSPKPDRILFFSAFDVVEFGGESGVTQFADFNFVNGDTSERQVAETGHDMFCPGISQLEDGRILINGGSNAEKVTMYEPDNNAFVAAPRMIVPRGYQSSATTSSGKVFVIGGSFYGPLGEKNGEIYDPATNEWTYLADTEPILTDDHDGVYHADNHAWIVSWKNESVFHAGPSREQVWYTTTDTGSTTPAGERDDTDAMCGVFVLYDAIEGKIFSAGGAPDYNNSQAITHAHITTMGEPGVPATVERVADLSIPRIFANVVVLPDGTLLVTGGQRYSIIFTDYQSVMTQELFDPRTGAWTTLASSGIPRNYHSISLLLPDGTVLSAGGGGCPTWGPTQPRPWCNDRRDADHLDGQIFSPPYLFNADGSPAERPVIDDISSETTYAGDTLTVQVSGAPIASWSLIRMGTATHAVNTDQRRIPLHDVATEDGTATIQLPDD